MWCINIMTFAWALCAAEEISLGNVDGTQGVEIREGNELIRTQYLPITKEVQLEVEGNPFKIQESSNCNYSQSEETKTQNSGYEVRNGTMFKVTRYKRKRKRTPCDIKEKHNAEKRRWASHYENTKNYSRSLANQNGLYNIIASLSGSLSRDSNESNRIPFTSNTGLVSNIPLRERFGNLIDGLSHNNEYGDLNTQPLTDAHLITSTAIHRKKDKLKKLLNLFTIVRFDNGGCLVDGLKGTCYTEEECHNREGQPMGPCARGFGVCCYIQRSCGQLTSENCTYFVSEGFPTVSKAAPRICALSVEKAHPSVRQLRIEFETFQLRGPADGSCLFDRFLITGQNRNSIVPDICGVNTGQHIYVDVDTVNGPLNLNVVTMGQDFGRKFRIKITQLRLGDELLAPQNCLQYYTDLTATIETFNYQHFQVENVGEAQPGYFNNLNYGICIKKAASFCTVTFSNQQQGEGEYQFQLINYDTSDEPTLPRGQAGADVFNCPDDYVILSDVRLCGDRLNDATQLDYTMSYPVTNTMAGPVQVNVKTNEANTSRGFRLIYKQNPCVD